MQQEDEKEFYESTERREKGFIGAILVDNHLMDLAVEHLLPSSFVFTKNRPIFAAMVELHKKRKDISPQSIIDEVIAHGEVADASYINSLTDDVPRALTSAKEDYVTRFVLSAVSMSIMAAAFSEMQLSDIGKLIVEKFSHLRRLTGTESLRIDEMQAGFTQILKG